MQEFHSQLGTTALKIPLTLGEGDLQEVGGEKIVMENYLHHGST